MSDYPNPNIHRGDATSGRGLLIAFAVIVAIVVLLALVGTMGGGGGEAGGENAITPAESAVTPGVETPVAPTE